MRSFRNAIERENKNREQCREKERDQRRCLGQIGESRFAEIISGWNVVASSRVRFPKHANLRSALTAICRCRRKKCDRGKTRRRKTAGFRCSFHILAPPPPLPPPPAKSIALQVRSASSTFNRPDTRQPDANFSSPLVILEIRTRSVSSLPHRRNLETKILELSLQQADSVT